MAAPDCMSDDGRQAVFVGTMLQTGDAVALCDECLVPWAAAVLHAMTGVDAAPFLAAVSDDTTLVELTDTGQEHVSDIRTASEAAPPTSIAKDGRGRRASRIAGTDTDPAGSIPANDHDASPSAA